MAQALPVLYRFNLAYTSSSHSYAGQACTFNIPGHRQRTPGKAFGTGNSEVRWG